MANTRRTPSSSSSKAKVTASSASASTPTADATSGKAKQQTRSTRSRRRRAGGANGANGASGGATGAGAGAGAGAGVTPKRSRAGRKRARPGSSSSSSAAAAAAGTSSQLPPTFTLQGLQSLPVPVGDGAATKVLFVKVVPQKPAEKGAGGSTLFVLLPDGVAQGDVSAVLSRAGTITGLEPGTMSCGGGDAGNGLAFVLVKFEEPKAAKRATKLKQSDVQDEGMNKWLRDLAATRPSVRVLQGEVDDWMTAFDKAEEAASTDKARAANEPDDDGFILVSHKRRGGGVSSAGQKRRRKKGPLEKTNFYKFQVREAKREQLAALRAKFDADKERVRKLKAARQFRPY